MVDRRSPDLTFTHARLLVTDYRACFRFYRDVLGFDVEWGDEDGVYADFRTGETTLAMYDRTAMAEAVGAEDMPVDVAQQDDLSLVFRVENVDDSYKRLKTEISFITEPHDQPG